MRKELEVLGVAAGFRGAMATVALPGYMPLQGPGRWAAHWPNNSKKDLTYRFKMNYFTLGM
jgi:hypothetical protein